MLRHLFFLVFLCGCIITSHAQTCKGGSCTPAQQKAAKKEGKRYYYEEKWEDDGQEDYRDFDDKEARKRDIPWKRKGFEFFIGGGIYFADKKTALYYNGAPENEINLGLLFNNEYYRNMVFDIIRRAYPYVVDNIQLKQQFDIDSRYSMAMDISLGVKTRIHKNWYLELSYSFRRLSAESRFEFYFPGVPEGNKENPPNSRWQYLMAREDRHYVDLSLGYIMQKHPIAKPFISVGALFNFIRINRFLAIIEDVPFDLMDLARYPNQMPGVQEMPNYRDWAGPGFGFSATVGLKIAINRMASLDPLFQFSAGRFGNSSNLPGFDTSLCFNYMVGVRLVMNDGLFSKNR